MPILRSIKELRDTPDSIVIALATRGELVAMEELIHRQHQHVRQFMSRLCYNKDQAEDLAQQVFLKLWRSIPSLKDPATYFGWQKMIMINVWKEFLRNQKIDFTDDFDLDDFEASATSYSSLNLDLNSALMKLNPAKRLCVVLAYHEGLTHPEIVELTNIPLGTVKSNIVRGSQELKTLLGTYSSENESEHGKTNHE